MTNPLEKQGDASIESLNGLSIVPARQGLRKYMDMFQLEIESIKRRKNDATSQKYTYFSDTDNGANKYDGWLQKHSTQISTSAVDAVAAALNDVGLLSHVFAFLSWKDILRCRVCSTFRQAVKVTNIPHSLNHTYATPDLYLNNREFAKSLSWIVEELPMIPCVNIRFNLFTTQVFEIAPGDNPEASFSSSTISDNTSAPVDLIHIAKFRHLKVLSINGASSMDGSYPYLFNFPSLQTLELVDVGQLKWDLNMLQGLPQLEELKVVRNNKLTGRLSDIKVLRKLVKLELISCFKISGDLMDLKGLSQLKEICLNDCHKICGDIRNVRPGDFISVTSFGKLPASVFGGSYLPCIADAPSIMYSWYILKRQNPVLLSPFHQNGQCRLSLSALSTERYDIDVHVSRAMPTCTEFVKAGSRLGWRWTNAVRGGSCEVVWLDPAPYLDDPGYDEYLMELANINQDVGFFKGCFAPPSREEHLRRNEEIPYDMAV